MGRYQVRDLVALLDKPRSSISRWLGIFPPFCERERTQKKAMHFDSIEILTFIALDALSREYALSETTLSALSRPLESSLRLHSDGLQGGLLKIKIKSGTVELVQKDSRADAGLYLDPQALILKFEAFVGLNAFVPTHQKPTNVVRLVERKRNAEGAKL